MTGEISNALEVLGAINKDAARRIDRLEEDLYGKDGLRVLITQLATRLEHVPEKLDTLTAEVASLKVAEQNHADSVKARRTIFKETLKWASKASAPLLAGVIGALTHRHFSGH